MPMLRLASVPVDDPRVNAVISSRIVRLGAPALSVFLMQDTMLLRICDRVKTTKRVADARRYATSQRQHKFGVRVEAV